VRKPPATKLAIASAARDELAARQLHALKQHYNGKLRLTDVKEMFLQTRNSGSF
jgi:hypothetical protein